MRIGKLVLGACLLLFVACVAVQAAESPAPSPAPSAPLLELGCAARKKVIEASKEIEMCYALTVARDKTATIIKPSVPLAWKVTDPAGAVILQIEPAKPAETVKLDGHTSLTCGVFAQENIKPQAKWPVGVVRVEASYAATRDMYKSLGSGAPPYAFVGEIASKPVEIVVKPDGWKEDTYGRYAKALERMLKSKLRPLAFEFPEVRDLESVTVAMTPEGAVGRFKLVREMLVDIDDDPKRMDVRLRRYEGFLEFAARDPLAERNLPPDLQGLAEDGLVSIEFRYDMTTNPAFTKRLPFIEEEILKDLQKKGPAAAEAYEVKPQEVMPTPTMPSTEDMLRSSPPEIPR